MEAKAKRVQAKATLEQAEAEAIRNIQSLCEGMRAEAQREIRKAKKLKAQAIKAQENAEAELTRATEEREQAEEARQRIVAEAEKEAQEIVDEAYAAARRRTAQLRRRALAQGRPMGANLWRQLSGERLTTQPRSQAVRRRIPTATEPWPRLSAAQRQFLAALPVFLGEAVLSTIWIGVFGALLSAVWSAALPGGGAGGVMWGATAAAAVTFVVIGVTGLGVKAKRQWVISYTLLFRDLSAIIGVVGLVVWLFRSVLLSGGG